MGFASLPEGDNDIVPAQSPYKPISTIHSPTPVVKPSPYDLPSSIGKPTTNVFQDLGEMPTPGISLMI